MEYMKFNELYDKIINEMKIISSPYSSYKINDDAMTPIIFNDVCICVSALNKDLFHVLKRIDERSKSKYNIDTVILIIKRYLSDKNNLKQLFSNKTRKIYSCSIQSKEFNLIKVQVMFEKNEARDIFSNGIENCKYFCFIYTILSKDMPEYESDMKLLVESNDVFVD